jgi:Zn-dependent protease
MFNLDPAELALRLPVIFFALTIHEFMHAWTAWKCGDDTALLQGRVSLNPLVHLDLFGTICLIFAPIGWAKPVPVNPHNYRNPRRDDILVSGAGIAANFTAGVVFALLFRVFRHDFSSLGTIGIPVATMIFLSSLINFGLFIFNLLPIFPLDGSHILKNLLPASAGQRLAEFQRIGPFLLLGLVVGDYVFANGLVIRDHVFAEPHGYSLLGYPINALFDFFAGF